MDHVETTVIGSTDVYRKRVSDGTNVFDGGWEYDANANEWSVYAGNTRRAYWDSAGTLVQLGNLTQDAANAVHTIGSASSPGSPATHAEVSATGLYEVRVDDQTNSNDGGWGYDANTNLFIIRAANAQQLYVGDGVLRGVADGGLDIGTNAFRLGDLYSDAAAIGGDINQDVATPSHILGDGSGSPTQYILKGAAGFGNLRFMATDTGESSGDFLRQHDSGENLVLYRHDGTANRNVESITDDTNMGLLPGAQGNGTLAVGPGATYGIDLVPGFDGAGSVGITGTRWGVGHANEWIGSEVSADGDVGGGLGRTTLTGTVESLTTGTVTLTDARTGLVHDGYAKIYVDGAAKYFPYFRDDS